MFKHKYGSRKFWVFVVSLISTSLLPLVYQAVGVPESVQLLIVGSITSSMGIYSASNVLAKKYGD